MEHIKRGWPELNSVTEKDEERIVEQDHGLSTLYNDWRILFTFHPEQKPFYELQGPYWYRYPQGENVPDVRKRNSSWVFTLIRDFSDKKVLAITHHLNILALRANLERLNEKQFLYLDKNQKPINCGVTIYTGYPNEGQDGHLKLESYNQKLY